MFKFVHTPVDIILSPYSQLLDHITSNNIQNRYHNVYNSESWDWRSLHMPISTPPIYRTSFPPGTIAYTPPEDLHYRRLYQTPVYFGRVSTPPVALSDEKTRNILALSQLPDNMRRTMHSKVNDNTNVLRGDDTHLSTNSWLIPSDVGHLSSKIFGTSLWSEQNGNGMDPGGGTDQGFYDVDPTLG